MTSIDTEIQTIVKDNKRFHFQLELSLTDDINRKEKLKTLISKLEYVPIKSNSEEKHKKIFEDIDKQVYAQPWNKLQKFHKESRIRLFVEDKFKDEKKKEIYLTMLLEALESGKLNTVKAVTYDSLEAKISEILVLKENDDGEFFIEIKKEKTKAKIKII